MTLRLPSVARFAAAAAAGLLVAVTGAGATGTSAIAGARPTCDLESQGNRIQHVINIVFDNVHLTRDDPNVPSDLEQMPNLLDFIEGNGTMISHQHTPLISHTGDDIVTQLTGLYGDQTGVPVANSFGFYNTNASASFKSMFQYWTDRIGASNDNTFFMTTSAGKNTPAPWVPFTRAGCNVGGVGAANIELENTGGDVQTVFGAGSPEDVERQQNPTKAAADFVGIAVHCGQGNAACAGDAGARADVLPDEPGGYSGFRGLFGARNANPFISPGGPVTDLTGNPITDRSGNPGFPGFDGMTAATSLGYVAQMQEHGVPVTYSYISDAHDNHATGNAFGPGEAGYVAALKSYDDAFGKFFARLAKDGINKSNTVFTVTSDENDHFVGGQGSPAGCDGVTTPCTYSKIGELSVSLNGLLSTVPPFSTGTPVPGLTVHTDSAPTVYLNGNPAQSDPVTRSVERASGHVTAVSPITGDTNKVTDQLAGVAAMQNLHMITGDAARNPTFTLFADPDFFICAGRAPSCPEVGAQVIENPGFAWNHGDSSPDVVNTWLGVVGPGVRHLGLDPDVWSDHTNIRPTELALVGLRDDYRHEGRVLTEILDRRALPGGFGNVDDYTRLAELYNQINAPVGQFGLATLRASTAALESGTDQNDSVFTTATQQLTDLGAQRNELAAALANRLDRPVSTVRSDHEQSVDSLEQQSLALLNRAWLISGQ
jgi:hypothetical protein